MQKEEKEDTKNAQLYFPLAQMSKSDSIFKDPEKGEFKTRYEPIIKPILGKQLAVNTYWQNDLIAPANTRISIDLLRFFDERKINFKVNRSDVTDEERDHALDLAMTGIIDSKRRFLETLKEQNVAEMQSSVHEVITHAISQYTTSKMEAHYAEVQAYLKFANSVLTTQDKFIATASALKKVMDNEREFFGLKSDDVGETIAHIVRTAWISLMIASQLDDFDDDDLKRLSIICIGHDGGKALIPKEVIYKRGRLTELEGDIMKSHVLLSYILASDNQQDLRFDAFAMALHHIKEDKLSPQSYSIAKDTHTSFFQYLTSPAQVMLNEIYHTTKKYYRVISIADTFEAITAERVYKKASSIGKTLEIMLGSNEKSVYYYQPYLDKLVQFVIRQFLPKNLQFAVTDEIIDNYIHQNNFTPTQKKYLRHHSRGVILKTCNTLDEQLLCMIYNIQTKKVEHKLMIPPLFFLNSFFFN